MRKLAQTCLVLLCAAACIAQKNDADQPKVIASADAATPSGLVPLSAPYTISTAPHFAVLVQFPRADSIRRIALGDSNYFLAEADKDDPHYAIVKQTQTSGEKGKPAVETNMLVYMASGRVINIMLQAGKLVETAYSIDYPVPRAQPEPAPVPPSPPAVAVEVLEKANRERARKDLTDKMLAEVKNNPKKQGQVIGGGLSLHFYRMERLDELALVSFDVENTSPGVVDLEDPRINLVTASDNGKDRKKNIPAD